MFEALDANGDGVISREEFDAIGQQYPIYAICQQYPVYAICQQYPVYAICKQYAVYAIGQQYAVYAICQQYLVYAICQQYPVYAICHRYPVYAICQQSPVYAIGQQSPVCAICQQYPAYPRVYKSGTPVVPCTPCLESSPCPLVDGMGSQIHFRWLMDPSLLKILSMHPRLISNLSDTNGDGILDETEIMAAVGVAVSVLTRPEPEP